MFKNLARTLQHIALSRIAVSQPSLPAPTVQLSAKELSFTGRGKGGKYSSKKGNARMVGETVFATIFIALVSCVVLEKRPARQVRGWQANPVRELVGSIRSLPSRTGSAPNNNRAAHRYRCYRT